LYVTHHYICVESIDNVQVLALERLSASHPEDRLTGGPHDILRTQSILLHQWVIADVSEADAEAAHFQSIAVVNLHGLHDGLAFEHDPPPRARHAGEI
jgi:hypothetical protein